MEVCSESLGFWLKAQMI